MKNEDKDVMLIIPQESPSNSVAEQISENLHETSNIISNAQLNPIESNSFSNFPIFQATKDSSSLIETNIINNPINKSSEIIFSDDIQSN